jgi:hypothetical protein
MLISNSEYEFRPPNDASALPILISGLQEYSPGQSRKSNVWRLRVPELYRDKISDDTECSSYGEVSRLLARAFFDGDELRVEPCITTKRER